MTAPTTEQFGAERPEEPPIQGAVTGHLLGAYPPAGRGLGLACWLAAVDRVLLEDFPWERKKVTVLAGALAVPCLMGMVSATTTVHVLTHADGLVWWYAGAGLLWALLVALIDRVIIQHNDVSEVVELDDGGYEVVEVPPGPSGRALRVLLVLLRVVVAIAMGLAVSSPLIAMVFQQEAYAAYKEGFADEKAADIVAATNEFDEEMTDARAADGDAATLDAEAAEQVQTRLADLERDLADAQQAVTDQRNACSDELLEGNVAEGRPPGEGEFYAACQALLDQAEADRDAIAEDVTALKDELGIDDEAAPGGEEAAPEGEEAAPEGEEAAPEGEEASTDDGTEGTAVAVVRGDIAEAVAVIEARQPRSADELGLADRIRYAHEGAGTTISLVVILLLIGLDISALLGKAVIGTLGVERVRDDASAVAAHMHRVRLETSLEDDPIPVARPVRPVGPRPFGAGAGAGSGSGDATDATDATGSAAEDRSDDGEPSKVMDGDDDDGGNAQAASGAAASAQAAAGGAAQPWELIAVSGAQVAYDPVPFNIHGGFSTLHRARILQPPQSNPSWARDGDQELVIKLPKLYVTGAEDNLRREVKVFDRLAAGMNFRDSGNIPELVLHDGGPQPAIVMRHYPRRDLDTVLLGPDGDIVQVTMTAGMVLFLAANLAEIATNLWSVGRVHGDAKPDNLLVNGDPDDPLQWSGINVEIGGDQGTVRFCDLAAVAGPATNIPLRTYTPGYKPPEEWPTDPKGRDLLVARDVYSLFGGITTFAMTGLTPNQFPMQGRSAAMVAVNPRLAAVRPLLDQVEIWCDPVPERRVHTTARWDVTGSELKEVVRRLYAAAVRDGWIDEVILAAGDVINHGLEML